MSTSWQWFPDTNAAICNYCGFQVSYIDAFPGHLEHDCDPAKHPALTARQGLPIGRSRRPEAASRVPLHRLLACIHRGSELRQEQCPTCSAGTRIKIFACEIYGECQLDDKIISVRCCGDCGDRAAPPVVLAIVLQSTRVARALPCPDGDKRHNRNGKDSGICSPRPASDVQNRNNCPPSTWEQLEEQRQGAGDQPQPQPGRSSFLVHADHFEAVL